MIVIGSLALLLVLVGLLGRSFDQEPLQLWQDATIHEREFRAAAAEMRERGTDTLVSAGDAQLSPTLKAVFDLGYFRVSNCHGVVLFIKYTRFRGRGLLGLTLAGQQGTSECSDRYVLRQKVPWNNSRVLPNDFFILEGLS
jgi:hypothetical protein